MTMANLDETRRFLRWLDPDAKKFTYQTFDDSPEKRPNLAEVRHGDLNGVLSYFERMQEKETAGVFVTINETDLKGRKNENIVRIRCVFVDLDGAPLDPVLDCDLHPHCIVKSSEGRYHCYWRVDGLTFDQYVGVQKALAKRFSGDELCCDPARVMRVPGFLHQKGSEKFVSNIYHMFDDEPPFSADEILQEFPPIYEEKKNVLEFPKGDTKIETLLNGLLTQQGSWHQQARDLTACLAQRGTPWPVVAALSEQITWPGYTIADTEDDLEKLWRGAKDKYAPPPTGDEHPARELLEKIHQHVVEDAKPSFLDLPTLNMRELAGKHPPARRYIIDQWLPAGCVTSLYGRGGVGKSLLSQQIATCVATGQDFFGNPVDKGPVFGVFAEDDWEEFWRRQQGINRGLTLGFEDLGDLHPHCRSMGGEAIDYTMVSFKSNGEPHLWPMLEAVEKKALELQPRLIILDNIAQVYGGSEIDRGQVTFFLNRVSHLAEVTGASVLLLGHPPKSAEVSYSGSTAWEAAVRMRITFERVIPDDRESPLILKKAKANYSSLDSITLKWSNGSYKLASDKNLSDAEKMENEARINACKDVVLKAVQQLIDSKVVCSEKPMARNSYAPRLIEQYNLNESYCFKDLERSMQNLILEGRLVPDSYLWTGGNYRKIMGLAPDDYNPDSI